MRAQEWEWETLSYTFFPHCAKVIHFLTEELPNKCLCRRFKAEKLKLVSYITAVSIQCVILNQIADLTCMNGVLSSLFWKALQQLYISRCYGAILPL